MKAILTGLILLGLNACTMDAEEYIKGHPGLSSSQKTLVRQHGAPKYPAWTWAIGLTDRCNQELDKDGALTWESKFWIWHRKHLPIGLAQGAVEWCRGVSCNHSFQHRGGYGSHEICDDGQLYYHFQDGRFASVTRL